MSRQVAGRPPTSAPPDASGAGDPARQRRSVHRCRASHCAPGVRHRLPARSPGTWDPAGCMRSGARAAHQHGGAHSRQRAQRVGEDVADLEGPQAERALERLDHDAVADDDGQRRADPRAGLGTYSQPARTAYATAWPTVASTSPRSAISTPGVPRGGSRETIPMRIARINAPIPHAGPPARRASGQRTRPVGVSGEDPAQIGELLAYASRRGATERRSR